MAASNKTIEEGLARNARVTAEANRTLHPVLAGDDAAKRLREQILLMDGARVGKIAILSFRALQLHRIAQLQAALITCQNHIMNPDALPKPTTSGAKSTAEDSKSTPPESKSEPQENDPNQDADALIQKYGGSKLQAPNCRPKRRDPNR